MPLIVNWAGDAISTSSMDANWSNKGGTFTSKRGIKTYFPLPMSYNSAILVRGYYTVPAQFANRADMIAKYLYGSEDYWWLVFWMSGIIDPFTGPKIGDVITIADINQVTSLLG